MTCKDNKVLLNKMEEFLKLGEWASNLNNITDSLIF